MFFIVTFKSFKYELYEVLSHVKLLKINRIQLSSLYREMSQRSYVLVKHSVYKLDVKKNIMTYKQA